MVEKINLLEKFQLFSDHWSPKVIGALNGQLIKIAKIKDEFIWHSHAEEDELFLVVKGTLHMDFRDGTQVIQPGEILVVPKGVEHRPRTGGEEVFILMIEPATTLNTGNQVNERTVEELDWI